MTIRHSAERDFNRIMEIYRIARNFMAEHGNPNQWGPTNWPPEELIHSDIQNRNSYVCLDDEGIVIGTFYFTHVSYRKYLTILTALIKGRAACHAQYPVNGNYGEAFQRSR